MNECIIIIIIIIIISKNYCLVSCILQVAAYGFPVSAVDAVSVASLDFTVREPL
jgi:hypothetical protein